MKDELFNLLYYKASYGFYLETQTSKELKYIHYNVSELKWMNYIMYHGYHVYITPKQVKPCKKYLNRIQNKKLIKEIKNIIIEYHLS